MIRKPSPGPRLVSADSLQSTPLRIAVVGYGYWGPNLARNVIERPELELAALCERDASRGAAFSQKVPGVPVHADLDTVLADPSIDAVVVATPPRTHFPIAGAALRRGQARAGREAAGAHHRRGGGARVEWRSAATWC